MIRFRSNIADFAPQDFWKALGLGLVTAVLLSVVMGAAFSAGIAPMPKQPSLAFAETLFRRELPLPVGLIFHLVYVTFWSVAFVGLFRHRLTFINALWLALALWVVALTVLFPFIGWGFLGLGFGPKVMVAALVPHFLFAVLLWLGCQTVFKAAKRSGK